MHFINKSLLFLVCALFYLNGFGDESKAISYRLGAILPLTGNASHIGDQIKAGMDIAVQEINSSDGINGKNLEIAYEDSKNDPKEGVSIFNRLVSTETTPIVISAMTGVTNAVIPIADSTKTVLMATGASASGLTDRSVYAHRLFITADLDAATMAKFAVQRLKLKRIAILQVHDEFGESFANIFKTKFQDASHKIVYREAFEKGTTDFRGLVQKLKNVSPDGIYILGYDNNLALLPIQIRQAGITVPILSIGTIGQPNVLAQAGVALENTYFTTTQFSADNPITPEAKRFVENYEQKYGKAPSYFSAFSYDAVHLLANAIKDGGYSSEGIRKSLNSGKTYHGAMGEIRIKPNRDADFKMVVKKIHDGVVHDAE